MLIVFAGPSLARTDRRRWADAETPVEIRPPAQQGDVLRAVGDRPWGLGLVDGYFEWVPAVWHKEILWAMSKGVRVYGAASMGALRAAELAPFGMRPVGWVADRYLSGELEADDEVTVVHADADDDYRPLSVPLVNVRATLDAAVEAGIVRGAAAEAIVARLRTVHYPERTDTAIADAARAVLDGRDADRLARWWTSHAIDVKHADAVEMVDRMVADRVAGGASPERARFRFEHTDAWEQVLRQVSSTQVPTRTVAGAASIPHDAVLDELRLRPGLHGQVRNEALMRALAEWAADGVPGGVSTALLEEAVRSFWARQPDGDDDLGRWLERHRMDERELTELIDRDASTRFVRTVAAADLDAAIADVIALRGLRSELIERAERKQADLAERGLTNPTLDQAGIGEDELWTWFFERVVGSPVPADLSGAALELGFAGEAGLRRVALREYVWAAAGSD